MQLVRRILGIVTGAALALLATPSLANPTYEVVLVSGARVTATSRPLVALGKVSFLDVNRRPVTLSSSDVDVEATRALMPGTSGSGKVWTEKSLSRRDRGGIQFYGDAPEPEVSADRTDIAASAPGGADLAPVERLRARIDTLGEKIRTLPTSDRGRSIMVIQQLELQQELSRLLDVPPARG